MSKFDGLFNARSGGKGPRKGTARKASVATLPIEVEAGERPRRGRPSGKRSDPDYVGFTTYIRKETHRQAKIALLEKDDGRELSELVEDLLTEWLKSKTKQ